MTNCRFFCFWGVCVHVCMHGFIWVMYPGQLWPMFSCKPGSRCNLSPLYDAHKCYFFRSEVIWQQGDVAVLRQIETHTHTQSTRLLICRYLRWFDQYGLSVFDESRRAVADFVEEMLIFHHLLFSHQNICRGEEIYQPVLSVKWIFLGHVAL